MRILLAIFLFIAMPVFGAVPDYKAFRGTGGITIVSNPPTGTIIIDGSGISSPTGGVSATTVSNIVLGNGTKIGAGANVTVTTNVTSSNIVYTVSSSGGISNANLLFVDTGGNNATAVRGRRDLPYLTPAAAKNAAVAGDTIVVFPGRYANATNLLKNRVNWIGYGATLTYTNLTNDLGVGIFDDRFSGAITSVVTGFSFDYSTGVEITNNLFAPSGGPTNVLGCIVLTNAASQLSLSFDRLDYRDVKTVTSASAITVHDSTNTFISGNLIQDLNLITDISLGLDDLGDEIYVQSKASAIYWERGECHFKIGRIMMRYYSIYCAGATNYVGNLWFDGDYVFGKLYVDGGAAGSNWKSWFNIKEIEVNKTNLTSVGTVTYFGGGKLYLKVDKIGATGTGVTTPDTCVLMLGGEMWLDAQKLSATGRWLDIRGGTAWMNISQFDDLGTVDMGIKISGGSTRLHGIDCVVTNTAGSAIFHSAGNIEIIGMRVATTNSSMSPLIMLTNGIVLKNCELVAKAGVPSAYATNAQSATFIGTVGNTAETNIAYLVGPWTVDSNVR